MNGWLNTTGCWQLRKKLTNKVLLIILDGWGLGRDYPGNAIKKAKTPVFDRLWHSFPHAVMAASGESVGLPEGQIGTSEVNHMTIGAGRVIFQDLVRINKAIKDKSFYQNPAFLQVCQHVKKNNSVLHIKGLVSPGGVHSHQDHIHALIRMAKAEGLKKVFIHVFTDGRDVPPKSAKKYVKDLEDFLKKEGVGSIASVSGRYYAMDRDNNWERTDKIFKLLTKGEGQRHKTSLEAIENSYKNGIHDEFILPAIIEQKEDNQGIISSGDGLIFANFRTDRPRQLTERLLGKGPKNIKMATMTRYRPDFQAEVAYQPQTISNCLGEVIAKHKLKQLRVTETEKFSHLTFFFNAKREQAFKGEDRIMLDSYSDIPTHDLKPEMRTLEITDKIIDNLDNYPLIITNFCNADMVGHTAKIESIIKGIEIIDKALGLLLAKASRKKFNVIITADHGNAEESLDKNGQPKTAHTANPVPFILMGKYKKFLKDESTLIDVAPTILKIMGIEKPVEMTGESLV